MIGALCILDDVTELEQVEQKLKTYQELSRELDAIIDASTNGLWICDGEANVLRLNPASERINNVRAEKVVGRNMRALESEGFIDRSVTLQVIQSGAKVSLLQRTRENRKLMISGTPVFDDQGQIVRVVVNEQDITEIDQLRQQLEEQAAMRDHFRHQMLEMQLAAFDAHQIVAQSPNFIKVLKQALRVSRVDSTVLILGESGTGKGVIADLVHKYSDRADRPMFELNCGAIPESLVESELFGYEKGAFTGASQAGKPGHLELAHQGILFLDEIGELPLSAQVKLLRFLEDGQVRRIGATRAKKVDVRVLCATNRDLNDMVASGQFRGDLFYRLNVIPLHIPPLRERRDCILPLLRYYVDHFVKKHRREVRLRFSRAAIEALLGYSYPGNVRELINICEQIAVMIDGPEIQIEDLPKNVRDDRNASPPVLCEQAIGQKTLADILNDTERRVLIEARQRFRTQEKIAEVLGVNQSTIARKIKRHGLG
ncbi:MAG TPA: PAS domain S-box protein [Desulfobacteraceae bacterium]|nr:PAS domain S-box protein [Desulfobacteraceae bacterium]